MTLSSMVVSSDWQEVSVLECILGSLHIGVDVESQPERAQAKLAKSKIDALIVDCDLDGATGFLRGLLNGQMQNLVPLVIVSGPKGHNSVAARGAAFIFQKPISVEQAVHTLSAARNMILDGRLRYHRHALDVPVALTHGSGKRIKAHLLNLSQGGMGIHAAKPLSSTGPVRVSFTLPETKLSVRLQGEVLWKDRQGNAGIRFLENNQRVKRELRLWLERRYLTR
jgi:hypothetical protein